MRITGGIYSGRKIRMPPGTVRPTMDRMRESFFGMLGPLDGVRFLDLFGGSGAVALEAASRGARKVVTVERDRKNGRILNENISLAEGTITVVFLPVERYIMMSSEEFDIVYIDPPFAYRYSGDLLNRIGSSRLIHPGSLVLIHHPGTSLGTPRGLSHEQTRRYGKSHLDVFRAEQPSEQQDTFAP